MLENQAQNSPPKNGKFANHQMQQTGPKTKSKVSLLVEQTNYCLSKAGNTMKQRKLEEKANKGNDKF